MGRKTKTLSVTSHVSASGSHLRRGQRSFLLMRLILTMRSNDGSPVIDLAVKFDGAGATPCNIVMQKNPFSVFWSRAVQRWGAARGRREQASRCRHKMRRVAIETPFTLTPHIIGRSILFAYAFLYPVGRRILPIRRTSGTSSGPSAEPEIAKRGHLENAEPFERSCLV